MRPFEKLSCFRLLRGRLWGVFDTLLRLGMCDSSKYRCNSPTGYVRPFKKLSRFRPLRGRGVGVCNTPLRLGTCCPSKNCPVFVSFGAACGAYSIRPYDWVRAILRNTDAILQLGTCCPSKNCPVFVPFGAACGAYAIRPYNRIRAILRNTDTISRPEGRGCLGGGAVGATACGGGGRE